MRPMPCQASEPRSASPYALKAALLASTPVFAPGREAAKPTDQRDLAPAALLHSGFDRTDGGDGGAHVYVENPRYVFPAFSIRPADVGHAGVGDRQIDRRRPADPVQALRQRVEFGQIENRRHYGRAPLRAVARDRGQTPLVAALQDQCAARRRILQRERAAKAAGGAGDQHGRRLGQWKRRGTRRFFAGGGNRDPALCPALWAAAATGVAMASAVTDGARDSINIRAERVVAHSQVPGRRRNERGGTGRRLRRFEQRQAGLLRHSRGAGDRPRPSFERLCQSLRVRAAPL